MGWLWAAYTMGSFRFPPGLSQEEFQQRVLTGIAGLRNFLVEDRNRKFASGRGPVALISVAGDGFRIEPNVAIFKWASRRNILRGFVAFFQWVKSSSDVGVCEVRVPSRDAGILKRMAGYGVLFPKQREILFSISGKKRK